MLVFTVVGTSIILFGSFWMQSKEQELFETLKAGKERIQAECLSVGGGDGQEGSTFTEKDAEEIKEILPEYAELAKLNPDFAGWISIEGTNIDYPVMQSLEDREYYLHRDFYGKKSYAGVPFVGSGREDQNGEVVFLYGHNMKNGTMFADLLKYQNKEYCKKHPIILLDTLYRHREYEIFAVFHVDEDDWKDENSLIYSIITEKINNQKIQSIMNRKLYGTGKQPEIGDSILFLITCSYRNAGDRFIVAGKSKQKN